MTLWSFQNYIMLKSSRKKRKKLIAIGCSYTENYKSFSAWPTHLAKELDMKCVNLGQRGAGNNYILSKIIDTVLTEKNIGLVVVMWSQFQRLDFQYEDSTVPVRDQWMHINLDYDRTKIYWKKWNILQNDLRGLHNPHSAIQNSLRTFILAENFLKDIPHLYIQGAMPISDYNTSTLGITDNFDGTPNPDQIRAAARVAAGLDDNENYDSIKVAVNSFIKSPYLNYAEKNVSKKFIGWPIFDIMGGYCVDDILDKLDPEQKELRISDEDTHPNAEGHKIISQKIYDAYAKIYI